MINFVCRAKNDFTSFSFERLTTGDVVKLFCKVDRTFNEDKQTKTQTIATNNCKFICNFVCEGLCNVTCKTQII